VSGCLCGLVCLFLLIRVCVCLCELVKLQSRSETRLDAPSLVNGHTGPRPVEVKTAPLVSLPAATRKSPPKRDIHSLEHAELSDLSLRALKKPKLTKPKRPKLTALRVVSKRVKKMPVTRMPAKFAAKMSAPVDPVVPKQFLSPILAREATSLVVAIDFMLNAKPGQSIIPSVISRARLLEAKSAASKIDQAALPDKPSTTKKCGLLDCTQSSAASLRLKTCTRCGEHFHRVCYGVKDICSNCVLLEEMYCDNEPHLLTHVQSHCEWPIDISQRTDIPNFSSIQLSHSAATRQYLNISSVPELVLAPLLSETQILQFIQHNVGMMHNAGHTFIDENYQLTESIDLTSLKNQDPKFESLHQQPSYIQSVIEAHKQLSKFNYPGPFYIDDTDGKGFGVFAHSQLLMHTVISEYTGIIDDLQNVNVDPSPVEDILNFISTGKAHNSLVIRSLHSEGKFGAMSRFINSVKYCDRHSANCEIFCAIVDGKPKMMIRATRVIEAGEELTICYGKEYDKHLNSLPMYYSEPSHSTGCTFSGAAAAATSRSAFQPTSHVSIPHPTPASASAAPLSPTSPGIVTGAVGYPTFELFHCYTQTVRGPHDSLFQDGVNEGNQYIGWHSPVRSFDDAGSESGRARPPSPWTHRPSAAQQATINIKLNCPSLAKCTILGEIQCRDGVSAKLKSKLDPRFKSGTGVIQQLIEFGSFSTLSCRFCDAFDLDLVIDDPSAKRADTEFIMLSTDVGLFDVISRDEHQESRDKPAANLYLQLRDDDKLYVIAKEELPMYSLLVVAKQIEFVFT
jgi:hypothetical protein